MSSCLKEKVYEGQDSTMATAKKQRTMAIVEVPSWVRNHAKSRALVLERMGGEALVSHALDRTLPLEYHLTPRENAHPLVGSVIKANSNESERPVKNSKLCGDMHGSSAEINPMPTHRVLLRVRTRSKRCHESSAEDMYTRKGTNNKKVTTNDECKQDIVSVDVLGVADRVGTFGTPADYAFVSGVPRPQCRSSIISTVQTLSTEPLLATVPYRFDGPLPSMVNTKDSSVQHAYNFQPSPAPRRNAKYSRLMNKERTGLAPHTVRFGAQTPTEPPPESLGRQRRGAFRSRYQKTLGILRDALQKRPIWRVPVLVIALESQLLKDVGADSEPERDISECLPEVAYKMINGPWINCWVRLGYNPAETPAGRVMQVSYLQCSFRFISCCCFFSQQLSLLDKSGIRRTIREA